MKKVTAYQLTSGEVVTDKATAIRKQTQIYFEAKVWEFAEKHGVYSDGKEQLANAILENVDELRKILNSSN